MENTGILISYEQEISKAETYDELLNTIADFTQILILLHPFKDGNGRTFLMFANYVLMLNGMTPLAFNHFSPIPNTPDQWRAIFKQAQWQGQLIMQESMRP